MEVQGGPRSETLGTEGAFELEQIRRGVELAEVHFGVGLLLPLHVGLPQWISFEIWRALDQWVSGVFCLDPLPSPHHPSANVNQQNYTPFSL